MESTCSRPEAGREEKRLLPRFLGRGRGLFRRMGKEEIREIAWGEVAGRRVGVRGMAWVGVLKVLFLLILTWYSK